MGCPLLPQLYDSNGLLLVYLKGVYSVLGATKSTLKLSVPSWHPYESTPDTAEVTEALSPLKLEPSSPELETAAQALRSLIEAKLRAGAGSAVFRVLDVTEVEGPSLLGHLSSMHLPAEGLVVEYYSATHESSLLVGLGSDATVGVEWLRTRKVRLSEGLEELDGLAFDAFVLNDWSASGAAPWTITPADPVASALASLSAVALPGAVLLPLGLSAEDSARWAGGHGRFGDCAGTDLPLLAVRLCGGRDVEASSTILVVSDDQAAASEAVELIASCSNGSWRAKQVVLDLDEVEAEAVTEAVARELSAVREEGQRFDGVLFLPAKADTTPYGVASFERLRKVAQAMTILEEQVEDLRKALCAGRKPSLWVVSRGAFAGESQPSQSTLFGFSRILQGELSHMTCRYVDMCSLGHLEPLARLIVSRPSERTFCFEPDGAKVLRYAPL
jgi:hypothetical protein